MTKIITVSLRGEEKKSHFSTRGECTGSCRWLIVETECHVLQGVEPCCLTTSRMEHVVDSTNGAMERLHAERVIHTWNISQD